MPDEIKKRLTKVEGEVADLKKHKHKHNNELHNISNILTITREVVSELKTVVSDSSKTTLQNTKQLVHIKAVALTIMFMGSLFFSFIVFVGGTLLKWW